MQLKKLQLNCPLSENLHGRKWIFLIAYSNNLKTKWLAEIIWKLLVSVEPVEHYKGGNMGLIVSISHVFLIIVASKDPVGIFY